MIVLVPKLVMMFLLQGGVAAYRSGTLVCADEGAACTFYYDCCSGLCGSNGECGKDAMDPAPTFVGFGGSENFEGRAKISWLFPG